MTAAPTAAPELNWSGTYRYRAAAVEHPATVAELQRLVRAGGRLHALGTRHSFTGVADGDGRLVALDRLPGSAVVDPAARTVTVPAAMRYGDLARVLDAQGWALDNLASLPHISVAGSVATATHGSGNANRSLASAVRGLTLVDGRGELVRLDRDAADLPGAVVGLGALGVVTEVMLAVEPAYPMRQDVYEQLPWSALTGSFAAVMGAGYSVSAVTDFAGDTVEMVWVKSRLDGPTPPPDALFGAPAATEQRHLTRGNDPAACTPQLGRPGPWYDRLPHFRLEFTPSSGAEIQSEWLIERSLAAGVIDALRAIGPRIAPSIRSAELRTVAAEELWLSPAYRQDVFGVHVTWHPEPVRVAAHVAEIEALLAPFRPRPHWAKVFGAGHDWAALYPRLDDFRRLVERYDPDGVFSNDFLRQTVLA